MPQPIRAKSSNQEGRILLAIQAIKERQIESTRAAAVLYDIPESTLCNRINGMTSRCDSTPNSCKLTSQEELAIIQYILELDSHRFSPQPQDVQEIADLLLVEHDASPVGINWTTNFIKYHIELKSKFSCKYNYKQA